MLKGGTDGSPGEKKERTARQMLAAHEALCEAFRREQDASLPAYAADPKFDAAVEAAQG